MKKQYEEDLKMEIQHIFDSGANEIRVLEMVKTFIKRRYVALTPIAVGQSQTEKGCEFCGNEIASSIKSVCVCCLDEMQQA